MTCNAIFRPKQVLPNANDDFVFSSHLCKRVDMAFGPQHIKTYIYNIIVGGGVVWFWIETSKWSKFLVKGWLKVNWASPLHANTFLTLKLSSKPRPVNGIF